jgi:hypothetical protein
MTGNTDEVDFVDEFVFGSQRASTPLPTTTAKVRLAPAAPSAPPGFGQVIFPSEITVVLPCRIGQGVDTT